MPTVSYPLDTTGFNPANKIEDEVHALTEINNSTYRIIIPNFAPFYQDNFVLKFVDTVGVETILTRDVHYTLTLPYISASRSIGKMIWGGIAINDVFIDGGLKTTYQTLGGDYASLADTVRNALIESLTNPRTSTWDLITNTPELFPPVNHSQDIDTLYGAEQLIDALNNIITAINNGPSPSNDVVKHFTDYTNPHHVDKTQVGLGNVENLPLATADDITAGVPVDKYVTHAQVKAMIAAALAP